MIMFSISVCFAFSNRVAPISSIQATVVQFSTFCSSRLSFRLVFDDLLKKLLICPQHFHILMTSNRKLATVPQVINIIEL